jgi:hypothetical protein
MKWFEKFVYEYWNSLKFLAVLVTIIIAYFGIDQYLDSKIESKITDDSYVSALSKTLRPFLVFSNDGIIVYDHGALNFIDSIKVKHTENRWADTIFIYTKSLLREAPLLQFIGVYLYSYEAKRIANFCWAYDMRPSSYLALEPSGKPTVDNVFTLEILK